MILYQVSNTSFWAETVYFESYEEAEKFSYKTFKEIINNRYSGYQYFEVIIKSFSIPEPVTPEYMVKLLNEDIDPAEDYSIVLMLNTDNNL